MAAFRAALYGVEPNPSLNSGSPLTKGLFRFEQNVWGIAAGLAVHDACSHAARIEGES